jgi:hypothetical protein
VRGTASGYPVTTGRYQKEDGSWNMVGLGADSVNPPT